ncbi:MAG: tetratricopeptide repeat protein, partial [Planctomycetales bacterium]|nr:tetratricopeptide repeat protein [Planctomycetales bacterium]
LDTAALVLLRNGQLSEAEAAIERALDKQPDNPSFAYHNALVSAASGRSAESARLLERALSSNQQFAERDAAQQMFDKLVTDTAIKNDR